MFACALFDLDGTLADTAPDLAAALNRMRSARGMGLITIDDVRDQVSSGTPGMLKLAFGVGPKMPEFEAYKAEFTRNYESAPSEHSRLFNGISQVLAHLDSQQCKWGVVTNKMSRFASPLVSSLGLAERAACLVYADTTPHLKPHPAPLLHAAQLCQVDPTRALYIGDDLRDVQAGRAAGMRTVAVTWGYATTDPREWGADEVVESPEDLTAFFKQLLAGN